MSVTDIALPDSPDPHSQASRLERLFFRLEEATRRGDLTEAVRLADSGRRLAPRDPTANLLLARLLVRTGAFGEALELLSSWAASRGSSLGTSWAWPASQATRCEALCRLGRAEEALTLARELIARHAIDCVDGLTAALNYLCEALPGRCAGWVGIDSQGAIGGAAPPGSRLDWQSGGAPAHLQLGAAAHAALVPFRQALQLPRGHATHVLCSQGYLLGSPLVPPDTYGYAGWVLGGRNSISGQLRSTWSTGRAATLLLAASDGAPGTAALRIELPAAGPEDCAFEIPYPPALGTSVDASVLLPDGGLLPLIGSPAVRPAETDALPVAERPARRAKSKVRAPSPPDIDVVVPVYAAREATLRCLESVLATALPAGTGLVVVDDASPDLELRAALDRLAAAGRLTLLRQPRNRGFPAAANVGMQLHTDRDVVLLNSDTQVYGDWLERLRAAAYSAPDIASVTPLGEDASIASYHAPSLGELGFERPERIDAVARRVNAGRAVEVPVGVGFCLYLRRACLDEIGTFDEQRFGRGYGEENDLCLRARRRGWRHVVATDVFVRHRGGGSFGAERTLRMARNGRVLNARHPGYDALVAEHLARDPLAGARRAIDLQCLLERARRPVLLVTHSLGGGIQRVVDRRADELAARGHSVLLLQSSRPPQQALRLQLRGEAFDNLRFELPGDADTLAAALQALGLAGIEWHHLLHLPDAALELLLGLGVPYRVFLHDYSWICPRLCLLGGEGRYCGEPQVQDCERCIGAHGSAFPAELSVAALRARSARLLAQAGEICGGSQDVRARYERYFPEAHITVTPWETLDAPAARPPPARAGRVRVAVLGALNTQKGFQVLLDCARDAAARELALEFVLVGYSSDDASLLDTGRVFVTGPYEEAEAPRLLAREACQIALFASLTPETWCFALTHALAAGLPVVAFDLGAVAERLRDVGGATLLPLGMAAADINASLLDAAAATASAAELPPSPSAAGASEALPAPANVLESGAARAPVEHAASIQTLDLPAGVYLFSIRGGAAAGPHGDELALPALQVGLAPLQQKGAVDFFGAPGTVDRWLAFAGDSVVARVAGAGAGLLLTSVRRAQDTPLAIDVRRIDVPLTPAGGEDRVAAVMVHVRQLGDLYFPGAAVGPLGPELWFEAFVVSGSDAAGAECFEYRGVTADGFETPWLSDAVLCGSRGRGTPLIGFAVRPRVAFARVLECRYSGRYASGRRTGPLSDGSLCRSELPNDPLVGIELQIVARE